MPYFDFDLVVGEAFKDQGELYIVRPELPSRGRAVRLTDGENKELYRTPLDPIPVWATARPSA
jgi:hypothetical protein